MIIQSQRLLSACRTLFSSTCRPSTCHRSVGRTFLRRSKANIASLHTRDSDLAQLNSATLGVEMPEITLGNGEKVQTGTVGALLRNISAYDDLVREMDAAGREGCEEKLRAEVFKYETMLRTPLPLLQKVGLFNLFSPEEWINGKSPGRKYVGRCAIEAGY
jgi:hypothetical protein